MCEKRIYILVLFTYTPTRTAGDTKITPSPLTYSIGMFLFVVYTKERPQ